MAQATIGFDDASGYERFMGRWSRAVAGRFLRWIEPARGAKWLDVGCGTGILTEAVLDLCEPASVIGIDPAAAQIEHASRGPAGSRATFRQADAMTLPFGARAFDITASALVINFIPNRLRALTEMVRVTKPGGSVAGYVWDFGQELSPSGPLRRAMRTLGAEVPTVPGTAYSTLDALRSLFADAGLDAIQSTTIDVTLAYPDLDDFWNAQTPGYSPTTKIINAMTDGERRRLKRAVLEVLQVGANDRIAYTACANVIRATVRRSGSPPRAN
jgi:ubiquinone/menaquinone biosynthesis C-methylase UbiE